jgi:hypothetical protein
MLNPSVVRQQSQNMVCDRDKASRGNTLLFLMYIIQILSQFIYVGYLSLWWNQNQILGSLVI